MPETKHNDHLLWAGGGGQGGGEVPVPPANTSSPTPPNPGADFLVAVACQS